MSDLVVSNASPLIALPQIGHLTLLEQLFTTVLVPPIVETEIAPSVPLPAWIHVQALRQPLAPATLHAPLDAGERTAISLALEVGVRWLVLDDYPARRLALALGLPVVGTLGILLEAKRKGLLPVIPPQIKALLQANFYIAPAVYQHALALVGELET